MKPRNAIEILERIESCLDETQQLDLINSIKTDFSNLIQLQSELKDTLFVRPYDIEKIEQAAVKLCDAIIELNEH